MDFILACDIHLRAILQRDLYWEATRILMAMGDCVIAQEINKIGSTRLQILLYCLQDGYETLIRAINVTNLTRNGTQDKQAQLLCMLSANATMLTVFTISPPPSTYVEKWRRELEQILTLLFDGRDTEKQQSIYYSLLDIPTTSKAATQGQQTLHQRTEGIPSSYVLPERLDRA